MIIEKFLLGIVLPFISGLIFNDNFIKEPYKFEVVGESIGISENYESELKIRTVEKVNASKEKPKMVAITYDDGPSSQTYKIIDFLDKYNAKATFFVVTGRVNSYKKLISRELESGYEVGIHSYNHKNLTTLSESSLASEISNQVFWDNFEYIPNVMRPPYGSNNQFVLDRVNEMVILWSIDSLDWKYRDADNITKIILNNVRDGDIILMHDLYATTYEATLRVVPELIKRGYKLVTVSEMLQEKGIEMEMGRVYRRAK